MAMLRKVWITTLGWLITLAGIAALVLPGPGLLLLLVGLLILSLEYAWAARRVEPVKRKAFEAAAAGVQTWPRIVLSLLSVLVMIGVGIAVGLDPRIPTVWIIGPRIPFGGWAAGSTIIASALVALSLIVYSWTQFRHGGGSRAETAGSERAADEDQIAS